MARICLSTQSYPPETGGVGVAASRLARTLARAGHDVHVVAPVLEAAGSMGGVRAAEEDGIHVHRVHHEPGSQEGMFALRSLVRNLDREVDFDLFHGFFLTAVYPCIGALTQGGRPRPLIASIRGSDATVLKDNLMTRAPILSSLRRADWVTSVNHAYIGLCSEDVDIRDRASVIRNSVEPVSQATARWQLSEANRGIVGLVGELRAVKDIPLLVRGYARVPQSLRRGLVLGGYFTDAGEAAWTERLIGELGVRKETRLTGRFAHSAVFDLLRGLNVYVQSSAFEGLPNALLEAACLGVPLVATAVGGMAEILRDGESGLLVPHGDPAALGAAIGRVLQDDALAMALSRGALALAAELSPERESREWLDLYDRLLCAPPRCGRA